MRLGRPHQPTHKAKPGADAAKARRFDRKCMTCRANPAIRVAGLSSSEGCSGSCTLVLDDDEHPLCFEIKVDKGLSGREMIDSLEHEWGHALGWTTSHPIHDDHGDIWAMARGRAYRVLLGILS